MSQQQWLSTVAAEQAFREELEAREIETANELIAESQASRADVEFIERMESLYPQLRAVWPGRTK